jgi:D-alanyl-D-alanine carboxypeptidase
MKRIMLGFCAVFLIIGVLPIQAQGGFDAAVAQQLQAQMDSAIEQGDPGIVMWVDAPQGVFIGVEGYADVNAGTLLQADDAFRIGSVTKMFTSVVILQLMEEGVLDLDDTLAQWLPTTAAQIPNGDVITLRQLLNHTSGIPDIEENEPLLIEYATSTELQQHQWLPEEIVGMIAGYDANFAPGEGWNYSNTGYAVLGMVIEAATGQSVVENYHSRILDPLGMTHTYLANAEVPTVALVRGYSEILNTDDYNASWAWSFGAMVSNAPDVVTFMRALMRGELFSDAATLDIMLTGTELSKDKDLEGSGCALGVFYSMSPLGIVYQHDGQIFGFNAYASYAPDYDLVVVILTNYDELYVDLETLQVALSQLGGTE